MASQRNEQDSLQMSIFAIELSKGPHSPPMRKGTAFTMKLEGSSPTFLMTSGAVVEQSGATSSSRLTCKRFGESLLEEKHPINPDSEGSFRSKGRILLSSFWMAMELKINQRRQAVQRGWNDDAEVYLPIIYILRKFLHHHDLGIQKWWRDLCFNRDWFWCGTCCELLQGIACSFHRRSRDGCWSRGLLVKRRPWVVLPRSKLPTWNRR